MRLTGLKPHYSKIVTRWSWNDQFQWNRGPASNQLLKLRDRHRFEQVRTLYLPWSWLFSISGPKNHWQMFPYYRQKWKCSKCLQLLSKRLLKPSGWVTNMLVSERFIIIIVEDTFCMLLWKLDPGMPTEIYTSFYSEYKQTWVCENIKPPLEIFLQCKDLSVFLCNSHGMQMFDGGLCQASLNSNFFKKVLSARVPFRYTNFSKSGAKNWEF